MGLKRTIAVSFACGLAIVACGPKQPGEGLPQPEELAVFPAPPDTARIQFLLSISKSSDIEERRSRSLFDKIAGVEAEDSVQFFGKPNSVATSPGRIYVTDQALPGVHIINLARRSVGILRSDGQGALPQPIACAVHPVSRTLYVADAVRSEVVVFDSTGTFVAALGESGARPTGVFADSTSLWVAYPGLKRVIRYDTGSLSAIGTVPANPESPESPIGLPTFVTARGDEVYVTDQGRFEVQVYSRTGVWRRTIGQHGSAPGAFARPKDLAVSRDSVLYVVDAAFQNVQMFNFTGDLLMWFGGPYAGPGYMYLPLGITIDYENTQYFEDYVRPGLELKYLVLVTNQFGPDKVSVYGFVGP